ncbi:MAG: [FeFe] hydrogenase H-cluster radical SAM maturase HydE [Tissierellia bacterium]|nr:[FeFe] hydrogenase H-cluster radical SAM maturase HydE [Tissierellia bacterium]
MQKSAYRFSQEDLAYLLSPQASKKDLEDLRQRAQDLTQSLYGKKIYIRGLIEFSNYCQEACRYCGIQATNPHIQRFRLSKETIYQQVSLGYGAGFRTFVLQGGEDPAYRDQDFCQIISWIKTTYPGVAVTLSLGLRTKASYRRLREAGADRYLLRHETANPQIFSQLHPPSQSLEARIRALEDLKDLGYQVGTGFLVGAPGTGPRDYMKDVLLIRQLDPAMIGMGPFIPHKDTPYKNHPPGSVDLTLRLLSILRLENPRALIPATTALNTAHPQGRLLGIQAGANVLMPNLSPPEAKKHYQLYDKKETQGLEDALGLKDLAKALETIGYKIDINRGDPIGGDYDL